ncbi:hypothetical protein DPMN_022169 [Dreissena polymorpha]|uniref:Uncharacterized protein n=1 Tax=Dreissena polymorpha TaxID=45954 RepID=A0A9D4SBJ0_DREPO|nr:hypothetical protein DPMN_022169 [Dreissena polymorpha]
MKFPTFQGSSANSVGGDNSHVFSATIFELSQVIIRTNVQTMKIAPPSGGHYLKDESSDDDEADNTRMNMISNQGGSELLNVLDKSEKYVTCIQFSAANADVQRDITSY